MLDKLRKSVDHITKSSEHQNIGSALDSASLAISNVVNHVSDGASSIKDKVAGADISAAALGYVTKFAAMSVNIVEQVDSHLVETNSPYEVSTFNVGGNIGIIGGFQLTISFAKTKTAKDIQAATASTVSGACPSCGATWSVDRMKLAGKPFANLRCVSCTAVFQIDGKSFQVVSNTKKP